jgi:hypothetical protein
MAAYGFFVCGDDILAEKVKVRVDMKEREKKRFCVNGAS